MSKELNKAPVEQAGGDERDFQAKGAQEVPSPVSKEYDRHLISLLRKGEALPGHQEEAADEIERLRDWNDHLNNTVLPNILNPNFLMLMKGGERLLDLCTKDGEFIGVSLNDMKDVFDWMVTHARIAPDQAALAQPSPAQAEQTEGFTHFPELLESVQQMDAMLKAEAERPIVSFEKYMQVMYARDENAKRLDAALARVAELEANLGAALGLLRESRGFVDRDNPLNESGQIKLLEEIDAFLNSPVAQVQHSVPRAWLDVQAERRRQVEVEGYHGFRDNHYINYELSKAARAYIEVSWHALSGGLPCKKPESWPWMAGFKWADGRTMLVKAGALILAEIERLDRAAAPGKEEV
ncbi:hypothetical protein JEZ45_30095 [Pseudomonas aeruginosa]|nr:hypothetical protein [Pseudomonas aeruginosa]